MSRQNRSIVLAERPTKDIVPGKTFAEKSEPAPTAADLKDGQVLVEVLYLSMDPAMRGWLNDKRSYLPPVQIGQIMRGAAICRVLASKSSKSKEGDLLLAYSGWRELAILNDNEYEAPYALPANAQVTDLLGALGNTGLTAYFGLQKIGQIKPGETVVVSGAAGATGSIVCQIAKLQGAGRVVGIAGSDDKVEWLKSELGCDIGLNYKDPDFFAKFKAATPDFIDVYWDNVGGELLDQALSRANKFARFVECGMISQYNAGADFQGPKNIGTVITMRIRMQGFIVLDYMSETPEARKQLTQWLGEGKIKRKETVVKGGLSKCPETLMGLFQGVNTGKLIVEVKNPEDSAKL